MNTEMKSVVVQEKYTTTASEHGTQEASCFLNVIRMNFQEGFFLDHIILNQKYLSITKNIDLVIILLTTICFSNPLKLLNTLSVAYQDEGENNLS